MYSAQRYSVIDKLLKYEKHCTFKHIMIPAFKYVDAAWFPPYLGSATCSDYTNVLGVKGEISKTQGTRVVQALV